MLTSRVAAVAFAQQGVGYGLAGGELVPAVHLGVTLGLARQRKRGSRDWGNRKKCDSAGLRTGRPACRVPTKRLLNACFSQCTFLLSKGAAN
jgi:hypothetical protein